MISLLSLLCAATLCGSPVYHPDGEVVTLSPEETRLAQAVTTLITAPGQAVPVVDTRLVVAARRLAHEDQAVRDVLGEAGVSDAFALPLRYGVVDASDRLAPVRPILGGDVRRAEPTHFGVGTAGDGQVALIFVRRGAVLGRFPKRLEVGERYLLNGNLAPDLDDVRLLVATPDGDVVEHTPRVRGRVFWRTLTFAAGPGRYTIEVQARDRHGVQVLNLMEVWAAPKNGATEQVPIVRLRPPERPTATLPEAEQRTVDLINRSRRQKGLPSLRQSPTLTAEARLHAKDMVAAGFFGHVSPRRGDLAARLAGTGLSPRLALENVAIAVSPEAAHAELLRSPSHLRNILDPDVTHIGVGAWHQHPGDKPVFTFCQIFSKL